MKYRQRRYHDDEKYEVLVKNRAVKTILVTGKVHFAQNNYIKDLAVEMFFQ